MVLPLVGAAAMWGGRIALPHLARFAAPLAARVGTMASGALGFAARRPLTTLIGTELATGGGISGFLGDQASGLLGNIAEGFMNNPMMQAGGMLGGAFLMNQVMGNGSMMGTLGMAGLGMAAFMPLMSAQNGFGRAGQALGSIFQGITQGMQNGDWSGLQRGFSQLGGVYSEGINNLTGIDLGGNTPRTPGTTTPTNTSPDATRLPTADATAPPAAPDSALQLGETVIAGAEAAEQRRTPVEGIGAMRRAARHGG